jgi:hypothetical protein
MDNLTIGTPAIHRSGESCFVSRIIPSNGRSFTLGTDRMEPVRNDVELCFERRLAVVPDTIAEPWIRSAVDRLPPVPADEVETRRQAALDAQQASRDLAQQDRDREATRAAEFKADAAGKLPPWAKAVIIAERVKDQSDSMSDYWGSTTAETVILAFSTHTRDLFPELRKAALNYADTRDLFDAPETAEHREKYSMGGGFYLKAGSRHGDGWRVSKNELYRGVDSIPVGKWSLTAPAATIEPAPVAPAESGSMAIEKHIHTKHGFDIWIVTNQARVEREAFDSMLAHAKLSGGWYSRAWGGTPGGFAFKKESAAAEFMRDHLPAAPVAPVPAANVPRLPVAPAAPVTAVADKLRAMADKLQSDIDHKFADRQTNTPKRQREAASARQEGVRLQRTQQALRALADHHAAGTVPACLKGATTKAAVYSLCRSHIDTSHSGYYDAGIDTGKPAVDSPATRAIWELLTAPSDAEKHAAELRRKVDALQFASIPGYFPTPAAIIDRMIYAADFPTDGCSMLEPSAGGGAILDRVRSVMGDCTFIAFERHSSLREILQLKGYDTTGADFTESDDSIKVDRVLMNPPFEHGQDMNHVSRAYCHLKPGGRLVAIMAPGWRYRQDRSSVLFREWFEETGGTCEDLPAGAFKESGTGVSTVMITIDAPAAV